VHEGGFTIRKDFQDHWRFFRPDGIAVPACGYIAHDAQAEKTLDAPGFTGRRPAALGVQT
jgi:hypothetical protein